MNVDSYHRLATLPHGTFRSDNTIIELLSVTFSRQCHADYPGLIQTSLQQDNSYEWLFVIVNSYSGTPLKRTPLGPKILSFIVRCP